MVSQCVSRIPHPPLRGTFPPGEGMNVRPFSNIQPLKPQSIRLCKRIYNTAVSTIIGKFAAYMPSKSVNGSGVMPLPASMVYPGRL